MADACISYHIGKDRKAKSSKRLRINISAKDIELLQKFQEDINISKDCIEVYTPHESTYSDNKMCKLVINSGLMYDDLVKHSITERKTGTECVPDTIPEHLIKHFIRGFLDGDGTIAKRGKNHVTLGFCSSSITILNQLNDIISKQTDLSLKHISKDNSKNMYYLNYTSSYDLVTLYNYLYKESTVHLNRKFAKFSNGLF
jgi:radical SAM superfamily enzyme